MPLPVAEVVGLPVFYVDTAISEAAGNGMVRVINCQTRNGILIPQFEVYIHAIRLVMAGRAVADAAQSVFNSEMMVSGARH